MTKTAAKTDPKLWSKVKDKVTEGGKGGEPGQWSARKAQLATAEYKKEGGGYKGRKTADNHLAEWTREGWGTKSGHDSAETGERYLPEKAREHLTDAEYRRSSDKKRADTAKGRQFSAQPKDVAAKTAKDRAGHRAGSGQTKAALMRRAAEAKIPGRSKMNKQELEKALRTHG